MIESWLHQASDTIWLGQLIIVLLVALLFHVLEARYYNSALERLHATKSLWDDAVLMAIHRPAKWFIWLVASSLILDTFKESASGTDLFPWTENFRLFGIIILVVWSLFRLIAQIEKNLSEPQEGRRTFDLSNARAIGRTLRVILFAIGGLVILNTAGVNLSGLLTFGGVGTLVVGLASQQLLANYFSGFMIFLDKPFKEGDWINSPDRDIEGTVEAIGWRLTRIRSFERRPMYVPNSVFASITVKNPSRMYNRRIKETIGVRYDDAARVPALLAGIREMVENHPDIDKRQALMVHLLHFGASSLDISLYCFTKTTDWKEYRSIQEDVLLKILKIIEDNGAECAFPTQTLHMPDGIQVAQEFSEERG